METITKAISDINLRAMQAVLAVEIREDFSDAQEKVNSLRNLVFDNSKLQQDTIKLKKELELFDPKRSNNLIVKIYRYAMRFFSPRFKTLKSKVSANEETLLQLYQLKNEEVRRVEAFLKKRQSSSSNADNSEDMIKEKEEEDVVIIDVKSESLDQPESVPVVNNEAVVIKSGDEYPKETIIHGFIQPLFKSIMNRGLGDQGQLYSLYQQLLTYIFATEKIENITYTMGGIGGNNIFELEYEEDVEIDLSPSIPFTTVTAHLPKHLTVTFKQESGIIEFSGDLPTIAIKVPFLSKKTVSFSNISFYSSGDKNGMYVRGEEFGQFVDSSDIIKKLSNS